MGRWEGKKVAGFHLSPFAFHLLGPTPQWLWDNNHAGRGYGSGPWLTNYVKCWMQDIGVKRQFLLTRDAALGPKK